MVHAESSARRFGGVPSDYLDIHQMMDSSKSLIADCRHRALTHNAWFIGPGGPLERIFGVEITTSAGRQVSVRTIAEMHILEDFGGRFIPSALDYLSRISFALWMDRGVGVPPPSAATLPRSREVTL
jgi:hypothetical protein